MPGEERYPARHVEPAADGSGTGPLDGVDDRERAVAWRLLLIVGLLSIAVQLLLLPMDRPPLWDESVYLSQVTPGSPAIEFLASRARGITILVAPVTWLGGSVTAVRVFLLLASAVATVAAYRVWIPLIGIAAPLGAITYCFSWIGLLNGSEIFPNPWAAILGLATTGLVARRVEGGEPRHTVAAAITICALALIRPTEAVALVAAIAIWILLFRRTRWRVLAGLGAGLALGWLPWIVEMSVRFGGPLGAIEAGANAGQVDARTGLAENVLVHLAATDGRRADAGAPFLGVVWWVLLGVVAAVAIARASRRVERSVSVLALIGALVLASEYLVLVSGTAPRFLLPTYALLSIPAGIAIATLLRGQALPRVVARVAGVLLLLLLLPWAIWQGRVADRYLSKRMVSTIAFENAGRTLRRLANGGSCAFQTPHGWPTTMFVSGCDGSDLVRPGGPTAAQLDELATRVDRVFVILKRPAPRSSPLRAKTPVVIEGPTVPWYVYEWP